MALTSKRLGFFIYLRSFYFILSSLMEQENIPVYPVVLHMIILGLISPFVNFQYHPKHLRKIGLKITWVSRGVSDIFLKQEIEN